VVGQDSLTRFDNAKKKKKKKKKKPAGNIPSANAPQTASAEKLIVQQNKPKPITVWVESNAVKKYDGKAKNQLGPKSWIAILIIGSVLSFYLKGKLTKYLVSKGWIKGSNVFANIIRVSGGSMEDIFKYFKGANIEKLREGIRKMHAEGAITSQERDDILQMLENPQVYRDIQTKFFDDAVKAYVKGGPNAPTANEILGLMTPKLREKYGAQIKAMETARKAAQGLGRKKPMISVSKLTPAQFKNAVADKNIERRFASRFYDESEFVKQLDQVRREITSKNPVPMFKETVTSLDMYKQLSKQHKVDLPTNQIELQNTEAEKIRLVISELNQAERSTRLKIDELAEHLIFKRKKFNLID
jgi:hypothetical protein